MRVALVLVAACWTSPPRPAPPVPTETPTVRTCRDAAIGLEHATKGLRDPDTDIKGPVVVACTDDRWPAPAIDCFATMHDDDLGKCASLLPDGNREKLLAALGGDYDDRAAIAVAVARLASVKPGIPECDQFVAAVATVLACEQMPLATRVQLGNETADFWSLPTAKLSTDMIKRMSAKCGQSLAALRQQAVGAGCKP